MNDYKTLLLLLLFCKMLAVWETTLVYKCSESYRIILFSNQQPETYAKHCTFFSPTS